ncbi:MAG: gliding motility-associated C-terminal domain-containing protein [Bacteroidota bacterium]
MDSKWETVAQNLGHTTEIFPQTILDNISNLQGYDVLIVSNGLIELNNTRLTIISQFIEQGGSAYIQAEYQITQPGNEAFEYAVSQLGGTFEWMGEMPGSLTPMNVEGKMAQDNYPVATVDHFWYGAFGEGDNNIIPFLQINNKHFGFIYCSPDQSVGKIVTTSDQDWIRLGYAENLAKNIIHFLANGSTITIPSIFVSVSNDQPCENEPVTFTANVGATPADIQYQWLVNNTPITNATNASFTSTFNDGDMVHCQITLSDGCATETVNTPPLEVLTIFPISSTPTLNVTTAFTTICASQSITATATPSTTQGMTNVSFQWMLNSQNIPGATNTTLTISTLNDGDVLTCQIIYDDACSNSNPINSNELTFAVNPSPTPFITINSDLTNICAGEMVEFTASTIDAGNMPDYQWIVDGNPVGINAPTFSTDNLTDAQVVTCQVTSSDACATTPTATSNDILVNVNTPVTPELFVQADQTTICAGETVTFTATNTLASSNAQYEWFVDGIPTGNSNNTFTTNNLMDEQSVTCQVTFGASCVTTNTLMSAPIPIEVTSVGTPIIEITTDATIVCPGSTLTFTATGNNLGTNPQYQWMVNGTITGNNANTLSTTFTTGQTVSCTVTANNTCSGAQTVNSNEIEITIGNLAIEMVDIQPESCDNSNGLITLTTVGGLAPYTYNWDNTTTNTNELTNLTAGDYSVVVTDVNGCSAALEINIPFISAPEIASVEATQINCANTFGSAEVIMEDSIAAYTYTWKNADNETVANSAVANYLQEGLYFVEITNENGCTISEEIYIDAADPVQLEILEPTTIELGETYELQIITNATDATFSWKTDATLSCLDCMNPTIRPTSTTTYFVTATTATGCTATAHVTIQVAKPRKVFAPNAFSPNNDGSNDRFTIFGGDDISKVKSFQIFDRWGSMVFSNGDFQPNDETQGWDGKVDGQKITTGVYIYIAEVEFTDGHTKIIKGDVTAVK